jgi:DNA mismatch endonuclease (patch repair protein)
MAAIRCKDTRPEMTVRRIAHRLGYRYRLHVRELPGSPDLVFPRLRKLILVHGCFWHMHACRYGRVTPRTRPDFWQTKRTGNVSRDRRTVRKLRRDGWRVLVIWECQVRDQEQLAARLSEFLAQDRRARRSLTSPHDAASTHRKSA